MIPGHIEKVFIMRMNAQQNMLLAVMLEALTIQKKFQCSIANPAMITLETVTLTIILKTWKMNLKIYLED